MVLMNATTIPMALPRYLCEVRPVRRDWILRCTKCKSHVRLDVGTVAPVANIGGFVGPIVTCCGQEMTAKVLKGTVNEHKCGAKCRNSKGHVCDCSCGGKNHGRNA